MFAAKMFSALVAASLLLCSTVSAGPIGDVLPDVELVTYDCRFCGTKLCPEDSATQWHMTRVETDKCHRFRSRTESDRAFPVHAFSNVVIKKGREITLFNDINCSEDAWQYAADYKHHQCFERAGGYAGLKAFRVSCTSPAGVFSKGE